MESVYRVMEEDRERLREPRGDVVQGDELAAEVKERDFNRLIAVGDRVSLDLSQQGLHPAISVVDRRVQREEIPETELETIEAERGERVHNPAGGVTVDAWRAVREAVARNCSTRLRVDGEEDLLALPAITFASPADLVVYGQRDVGAVILEPDAELKDFVEELLNRRDHGHAIVGGSWEHLHCGHRSLLLEAFARGEKVDVGVTTDAFLEEKLGNDKFEPLADRKERLENFLELHGLEERGRLMEIDGYRGNAVEEGDALVVTDETLGTAEKINRERQGKGREPLDIVEVPLVMGEDGNPVSSSRIRAAEIDGDGRPV